MYIRRKVFSLMKDENGEEKYFSTTEISNGEVKLFAEKEEKSKNKVDLDEVDSNKGFKRSIASMGITGYGSIAARKAGRKAADKADAEGKSDEAILREAGNAGLKRGATVGALTEGVAAGSIGAGIGAVAGSKALNKLKRTAKTNPEARLALKKLGKNPIAKAAAIAGTAYGLSGAGVGGVMGAIGGRNSARVQTKDRLQKRASRERDIERYNNK